MIGNRKGCNSDSDVYNNTVACIQEKDCSDKQLNICKNETYYNIPVWERYTLTVNEAAEYYHIGETKLRRIAEEHPEDDFTILNGNRLLFKREKFERFLDKVTIL